MKYPKTRNELLGDLQGAIPRFGETMGSLKSTLVPPRKISLDTRFWYLGYIRVIAESKNKRAVLRVGLTRNGLMGCERIVMGVLAMIHGCGGACFDQWAILSLFLRQKSL